MEKFKIWLIVIVGLVLQAPVGAIADIYTQTIMDSTLVIPYRGTSPTDQYNGGAPLDVIASNFSLWDIKQVAVTQDTAKNTVEMKIYTNYAPGGVEGAGQGDIALRLGGTTWAYGIGMAGIDANHLSITSALVPVTSWLTTKQIPNPPWSGGGYYYAGAYGSSTQNFEIVSVLQDPGASLASVTVNYSPSNVISAYLVDLLFDQGNTNLNFTSFDFLIKSGTCGNDTMAGTATKPDNPVPLPPQRPAPGTGPVGLVGLGWRRRKTNV